MLQQELRSERE